MPFHLTTNGRLFYAALPCQTLILFKKLENPKKSKNIKRKTVPTDDFETVFGCPPLTVSVKPFHLVQMDIFDDYSIVLHPNDDEIKLW